MQQTAIVTGATGNLGQAVVRNFLDAGMKVIATILPGESLEEFKGHAQFYAHEVDVTSEAAVQAFARQVSKENASIDIAALLVGGFAMGNINETTGKDLKKMFTLNFEAAYFLARELFMQMTKQTSGGRIFLVGARPALVPQAGKNMVAYALSKSLIFHLAELLNAEGKSKNVVTSVLVPSTLDTPQNRSSMPDAHFSDWVKPEEVAEIIRFAASPSARCLREPIIKVYGNA